MVSCGKGTNRRLTGPCAIYLHAGELMRLTLSAGLFFALMSGAADNDPQRVISVMLKRDLHPGRGLLPFLNFRGPDQQTLRVDAILLHEVVLHPLGPLLPE